MRNSHQTDTDYVARAAWLHYIGGLTQGQVADHLNVTVTRAHRLIARALADGLVQIKVDVQASECVVLEKKLIDQFGLLFSRVAMTVPESDDIPLRTLSAIGSNYLAEVISGTKHSIIGLGHGRTLVASINAMERFQTSNKKFVSVLGGLTRSFSANPYDVIFLTAQKTGAESHLLPAPLYANSAKDKKIMMQQTGISATMSLIKEATLIVLGIGNLFPFKGSSAFNALENVKKVEALHKQGAVAELLGQYITLEGECLSTEYDQRVMAPPLKELKGKQITAIAGGPDKVLAIKAAMASGFLTGLLTDEATARKLVEE